MDPRPDVTVVIPTRNRCSMLQEAVASVMQQSYEHWELVVVDDASDDSTWQWLNGLQDARVRPIRQECPSERATARNAGLAAARGEFLLFLDDDDWLPRHALEAHREALRSHPATIASVGGHTTFGEGRKLHEIPMVWRHSVRSIFLDVLFMAPPVSGQCLIGVKALKAVGGWDGSHIPIEDHVLWLRVSQLGPVVLTPESLLMYRVHPGQWRPDNLDQMMTEVREQAVRGLSGPDREVGRRILEGRAMAGHAHQRYKRGEAFSAFMQFARILLMLPSVRRSPLTRPRLLFAMLKCIIGSRALHILRRVGRAVFRLGTGAEHQIPTPSWRAEPSEGHR